MKYIPAALFVCALALLTSCRPSPEKILATADKYHAKRKYKEAEILYAKVLAKDKRNAEAYYKGGLNFLDEGKPREAVQYLRRAVDIQPSNTDAEAKLAELYLTAYVTAPDRLKQLRPDIDDLVKKMLQHDPNSFDAARIQAILDLRDHKTDEALRAFAKANAIRPHSPRLVGWYAQTLIQTGHPDQALSLVKETLASNKTWSPGYDFLFLYYHQQKNPAQEEAVLREHVQNDPKNPAAFISLANYLAVTNRADEGESVMKRMLADPKQFPQAHEMLGDFYARTKKFDQAIQQYQVGTQRDPQRALTNQERIVLVDTRMGKMADAVKLAKSLAEQHPKDTTANEMYASLLVESGLRENIEKSIAELVSLSKNNPANAVLHLDLAKAYLAGNQPDKALSECQEALQGEGKNPNPREAVMLTGRLISARIYQALGQPAQSLSQANQVLAAQPANPEARLLKDQALAGLNQGSQATDDLLALIKQFPNLTDARLTLGQIYLTQNQYQLAGDQFDAVWNSAAKDVRGFVGIQHVKFAEGKIDEAVHNMADLVSKAPNNSELRLQLAQFQTAAGQTIGAKDPSAAKAYITQAADNLKQILKASPNSLPVWLGLGTLQRMLGQNDAALGSFEHANQLDARNVPAMVSRAEVLDSMDRKKEAADLYSQALTIDPNNASALNNLAFLNAEQGTNLDQAMTFAERAKQQAPKNPDVSDTLGYVYLRKNLNTQALEIFRQNVQDQPRNPTFHLHLAMALLKKGDKQGAKEEAEKAMKIAPPAQQTEIKNFVGQIG